MNIKIGTKVKVTRETLRSMGVHEPYHENQMSGKVVGVGLSSDVYHITFDDGSSAYLRRNNFGVVSNMNILLVLRRCTWWIDGKVYQSEDDDQGISVWQGFGKLYHDDGNERAPDVDPDVVTAVKLKLGL